MTILFTPATPDPDYELVWPRELFRAEARALLRRPPTPYWVEEAELLLEEAFAGDRPRTELRAAAGVSRQTHKPNWATVLEPWTPLLIDDYKTQQASPSYSHVDERAPRVP